MSNKVKFVLDKAAFRQLVLQSPEMLAMTQNEALKIADADTHIKSFVGFDRAKTVIYPNTKEYPS